jgi:aminoglycoside phosphotransferase (APT) family kinase protein
MAATNLARAAGIVTPLGRDDRRSTLVVPWQPGEVLIALPTHTWPREIPSVVELLLRLHRSAPDILRPVYRGEVTCLPFDLEPALGTLVAHANKLAAQAAGALKSTDRSLLHGDVSADQIVISNRGPAIIDWDRCHIGPGSIDFGALAASLIFDAGMAPGDSVDCVAAALCDNDAEWLVADLPQATALAAIGRAVEPFRLLYDDWPRAVVDRVTVADLLLQTRSSTSIGKSANSANAPDPIAKLEYLAERAVDRESSAFAAVERVLTEEYGQGKVTEATVVRLKPDRRAIVRYRFILDHGGESEALAKIRVKGLDHRAFEIQFALANAWRQSADGLGCARAIGTVPSAHLWLQSVVDGHDGTAALIGEYESSRFGDWAAALMMKLHRTPLSVRRRWTVDDEADMLTAALANVAEGRRDLSDRIARLAQASRLCLAELGPPPAETVIHRDFYHDQVMVAAEAAFLIDLDLAAIGDPAQDAGNFLAHLDELAIREPAIAENVRAAATAFRERLLDAPDLYSAARVAAFNAISLARLVAVSHRISSRRASTGRLLAAAEQMLSSRATRA